jgi:hypothetical protein
VIWNPVVPAQGVGDVVVDALDVLNGDRDLESKLEQCTEVDQTVKLRVTSRVTSHGCDGCRRVGMNDDVAVERAWADDAHRDHDGRELPVGR